MAGVSGSWVGQGIPGTQPAWVAVSFSNSWVDFGGAYETAAYMKDKLGFVHLKGVIKTGTIGTACFTLPAGYRPSATTYMACASNGSIGVLQITSAGVATPVNGSSSSFGISGLTFRADN